MTAGEAAAVISTAEAVTAGEAAAVISTVESATAAAEVIAVASLGENRDKWDTKCPISLGPSGKH